LALQHRPNAFLDCLVLGHALASDALHRHPASASRHNSEPPPARAYCRASSAGRVGAWASLDDLVGAGEERDRNWQIDLLGCFQIDD
jgi:hypothetical protein